MRIDASPLHDLPEIDPAAVQRTFVICTTPRCGSTLLARVMQTTGRLGVPAEYFNRRHLAGYAARFGTDDLSSLIDHLKRHRSSPNGVFGFKCQFNHFYELMTAVPIEERFPNLSFIVITREDQIMQSVSYVRALQTGAWSSDYPERGAPRFNLRALQRALARIQKWQRRWDRLLERRKARPLRITYEQLCNEPSGAVTQVFQLLGLAETARVSLADIDLRIQRGAESLDWAERLREALKRDNLRQI